MDLQALRYGAVAVLLLLALNACADEKSPPADPRLPQPVSGITFDEWAAGNARLANKQTLDGVLETLEVDKSQWDEANTAFTKALKERDPRSYTYQRYGEVFADPAVGRFAEAGDNPRLQGKLATFEDYARVQAHLTVATQAGKDPQEILKKHDLTVYEFSQESGRWVQEMARAAGGGDIERMNRIREGFEAEYREKYGLGEK